MIRKLLFSAVVAVTFFFSSNAQTSKYSVGVFGDIMLEAPTYDTFYGVNGKYDFNNHNGVQAFVGYSNVHMTTFGADFIYNIKDKTQSNFNVYGGIGLSGDFYKQKVEIDFQSTKAHGYAKASYLALNPTVGVSYYFKPVNTTVFAGYKVKYYVFEDALNINYLSLGVRYHL